jgi:hypothetical protein
MGSDFIDSGAPDLGELLQGFHDKGRLVRLAAKGNRREVGCVGFDKQAVVGDFASRCANVIGILVGENSLKRHVGAKRQAAPRQLGLR